MTSVRERVFPLAHVGFTVAAVELARRVPRFAAVARWPWVAVAVGAMLPDALDKPLGHGILDWGAGRLFGHSIAFVALLVLTAVALDRRGSRRAAAAVAALAFGSAAHLALDGIWRSPEVMLWPLLGPIPHGDFQPAQWVAILLSDRFIQVTEAAGAVAVAWSARAEWTRRFGSVRRVPVTGAPEARVAAREPRAR